MSAALVVAIPGTAFAAPGDPDPTWGEDGSVVVPSPIDPDRPLQDSYRPLAMRDGSAVVSIDLSGADIEWAQEILRLDRDGDRDLGFGDDGVIMPFADRVGAGDLETRTRDLDELPGRDLLVTGIHRNTRGFEPPSRLYVQRYESSGELDGSYATDGTYELRFGKEAAWTTSVASDGSSVSCGTHLRQIRVVRLDASGAPVAGFGVDGVAKAKSARKANLADCRVLADGSVAVLQAGLARRAVLGRFTSAGELDTSYGTGGFAVLPGRSFGPSAYGRVLADGSAVVLGAMDDELAVRKVDADGELDKSYGDGGTGVISAPGGVDLVGRGTGVAIDGAGRVVGSSLGFVAGGAVTYVGRLTRDGDLDTSYGDGGVVLFAEDDTGPYELDVYRDGRTLIGGYGDDGFDLVLTRLEA